MADVTRELLQPALLDRLTDDEPQRQAESRDQRVLTMRQFRASVLRDLAWLLNTGNYDSSEMFDEYPYVQDSVINFGIRDLTGMTGTGVSAADVERSVRQAILRYEPRIIPSTLEVRIKISDEASSHHAVMFEITGDLWASPIPERLYLQTKVDLETGAVEVESLGGAG